MFTDNRPDVTEHWQCWRRWQWRCGTV